MIKIRSKLYFPRMNNRIYGRTHHLENKAKDKNKGEIKR